MCGGHFVPSLSPCRSVRWMCGGHFVPSVSPCRSVRWMGVISVAPGATLSLGNQQTALNHSKTHRHMHTCAHMHTHTGIHTHQHTNTYTHTLSPERHESFMLPLAIIPEA